MSKIKKYQVGADLLTEEQLWEQIKEESGKGKLGDLVAKIGEAVEVEEEEEELKLEEMQTLAGMLTLEEFEEMLEKQLPKCLKALSKAIDKENEKS